MSDRWILFYDVVPDYLERRGAIRAEHLAHAQRAIDAGALLLAGAYADPADCAALVFAAPDRTVAEEFARADPYVRDGLVTSWRVREWTVVTGLLHGQPS